MIRKKEKILVAMSGGVDSSVAAALLLKQCYDVTGMFAVNYQASSARLVAGGLRPTSSEDEFTGRSPEGAETCWLPDYRDATRVAAKLGIKLIKLDFRKEYKKLVLNYMFREYKAGRTPNPDVLCNKFVKFGVWLDKAKKLGFDKLATGHYAKIMEHGTLNTEQGGKKGDSCYVLHVPSDNDKDQTYFLHQLNQKQLQHVLLPLADYTKTEVRKLAKKFDLPTADKEESMGICFIGEVPMKEFLQTQITQKKGKITLSDGTVVGEHEGLAFYTIGERVGVRCHPDRSAGGRRAEGSLVSRDSRPLFVVDKKIKENKLVIGFQDDPLLYKKQISVNSVHWIAGHPPKFPLKFKVRLRHRQPLQDAIVTRIRGLHADDADNADCKCLIKFEKPQRAVTPGQFAVFYKKESLQGVVRPRRTETCLGGGIITK